MACVDCPTRNNTLDYQIQELYTLRNSDGDISTLGLIEADENLGRLMREVYEKVKEYFGSGDKLFLEITEGLEETENSKLSNKEFLVFIPTSLTPEKAIERLRKFDENWWLDASTIAKNLSIHVEFN